jgi:hypothetical protein
MELWILWIKIFFLHFLEKEIKTHFARWICCFGEPETWVWQCTLMQLHRLVLCSSTFLKFLVQKKRFFCCCMNLMELWIFPFLFLHFLEKERNTHFARGICCFGEPDTWVRHCIGTLMQLHKLVLCSSTFLKFLAQNFGNFDMTLMELCICIFLGHFLEKERNTHFAQAICCFGEPDRNLGSDNNVHSCSSTNWVLRTIASWRNFTNLEAHLFSPY